VLAAIDWGEFWDWIEGHGVAVTLILAAIGGAFKAGMWWVKRRQHQDEKKAAAEADRVRAEERLDATHVDFGRWACVPFGTGTGYI
jgi:hypothetical protein